MILTEVVARMTGCSKEEAEDQLELAEQDILRETNRKLLPASLLSAQLDIAVIRINRMGTEGETSRSEGGISSSFESLPDYLRKLVSSYRLAGVGGHAFESKTDKAVPFEKATR